MTRTELESMLERVNDELKSVEASRIQHVEAVRAHRHEINRIKKLDLSRLDGEKNELEHQRKLVERALKKARK